MVMIFKELLIGIDQQQGGEYLAYIYRIIDNVYIVTYVYGIIYNVQNCIKLFFFLLLIFKSIFLYNALCNEITASIVIPYILASVIFTAVGVTRNYYC